jgi:hypothetical protein
MQFSLAIVTLLATAISALPTEEKRQAYIPCSGLYGTSQCCATDVLGVADLDCGNRKFRHVLSKVRSNISSSRRPCQRH